MARLGPAGSKAHQRCIRVQKNNSKNIFRKLTEDLGNQLCCVRCKGFALTGLGSEIVHDGLFSLKHHHIPNPQPSRVGCALAGRSWRGAADHFLRPSPHLALHSHHCLALRGSVPARGHRQPHSRIQGSRHKDNNRSGPWM